MHLHKGLEKHALPTLNLPATQIKILLVQKFLELLRRSTAHSRHPTVEGKDQRYQGNDIREKQTQGAVFVLGYSVPKRKKQHDGNIQHRCEITLGKLEDPRTRQLFNSCFLLDWSTYMIASADSIAFRKMVDAGWSSKW